MPKNKKLSKPHNDFYQQALSHTQVAQEFFATNLPKHILDIIDLDTTPEKDTFSDHQAGLVWKNVYIPIDEHNTVRQADLSNFAR